MSPPSIGASLIFFFVAPLTLLQRCGAAGSNTTFNPQYNFCAASAGRLSRVYPANLNRYSDFPSNAIRISRFFDGTFGWETVFGMVMCQAVSAKAPMACPSSSKASAASQGCVLWYSDAPILAVINDDITNCYAFYTQIHEASVPDAAIFAEARNQLFEKLAPQAALAASMTASSDKGPFNATHNLYGLAQCTRELPGELCSYMIKSIVQRIPDFMTDVQRSEGVSITGYGFYIEYELKPSGVSPTTGTLVEKVVVIGIPVFISTILLLVVLIVMIHRQKKRQIARILELTNLQIFLYRQIRSATMNFTTVIGQGGFGKVYKATFRIDNNDQDLAVKCVTNWSALKQLLNELNILASLNHRNVVKLKGFCDNEGWFSFGKHPRGLYVCSEFFSHGSLDTYIFGSENNPRVPLEWPIRCEIICGICDGLRYLHVHCDHNIAHLDLKPSNILLDQEMKPKIADFGLSKTFMATKTHTYTYSVMGTNGYMAPELTEPNANNQHGVGCRSDIYSLGVLILAIVMGEGPTATHDPNGVKFIEKIREKFSAENRSDMNRNQLKEDASLRDHDCLEDVESCIDLAFECVEHDPQRRPQLNVICDRLPTRAAGTS